MSFSISHHTILNILCRNRPRAIAWITGSKDFPELNGTVRFYNLPYDGTLIEAELFNLPDSTNGNMQAFFGFHIHENGDCSGAFENTGSHYNPSGANHPFHAGDMPPLMSDNGYAWTAFYDARVQISEILNRSVVIHRMPDDFKTQPAGDAGEKIACGVILPSRM